MFRDMLERLTYYYATHVPRDTRLLQSEYNAICLVRAVNYAAAFTKLVTDIRQMSAAVYKVVPESIPDHAMKPYILTASNRTEGEVTLDWVVKQVNRC
ncbi:hypothetical protein EON65_45865 [archaeon]|nr:MAG: hypothetical protein EON65_45865 [archaeon]